MARYAQSANLNLDEDLLIQLTDSPSATGVKDSVLIERLGTEVDGLIDGMLFGKYVTPIADPTPVILTMIAEALWRMQLFRHRPTMEPTTDIIDDYRWAMSMLKAYARGDEFLAALRVQAPTDPTVGGGAVSSDSDDRLFGRAKDGL